MLFSDEGKPKGFVTTRTTLKDCLKPVLQTEKKRYSLKQPHSSSIFQMRKSQGSKGLIAQVTHLISGRAETQAQAIWF